MIYDALANNKESLNWFDRASDLDPYLAVAHFQSGVSNFVSTLVISNTWIHMAYKHTSET